MANLLKWAEDRVKNVEQAAQTAQHGVSRAVAQVNPLDNGRTWQNNAPQQAHQGSVAQQATHNGATNFVGNSFVKPYARIPFNVANQAYNSAVAPVFNLPKMSVGQAPGGHFATKQLGATGKLSQSAGDITTTAANLLMPGSSKLVTGAVGHVLPKAVPKIASRAIANSGVGAVGGGINNVGAQLSAGNIHSVKDIPKAFEQGAKPGALLAGGGTLAAPVLKVAAKQLGKAAKNTPQAAQAIKQVADKTDPRVRELDQNYKDLNTRWQSANTQSRANIEKAISVNRQSRAEITKVKLGGSTKGSNKTPYSNAKNAYKATRPQEPQLPLKNSQAGLPSGKVSPSNVTPSLTNAEAVNTGNIPQVPKNSQRSLSQKQPRLLPQDQAPLRQVPGTKDASSLPNNTPTPVNPQEYIAQQTASQEAARKAGTGNKLSTAKNDFKRTIVDSFAPIEDTLNSAVKSGTKIAPENNIKFQIDRALRADTIAGQHIKDSGLAHIIQSAPDTKALDQYLIAKHAADLEASGVKTGRNPAADKQLVEALAPQYEAHAQAVNSYNRDLLDKATNYGLVSKETAQMLKAKYPNYVPANRIFGENEIKVPKGVGGGKASLSSQSVVQKIKGSERQIESPLASIVKKTQDVIDQGERNKAASILASYKSIPGNPFSLRELGKGETVGTKPVISYLDKGVTHRFETTPEIAAAAKSLDKQQLGIIGQIAAVPTRMLRLGATGLNVGFTMANVTKDVASAFINSEHPFSSGSPTALRDGFIAAFNHGSKQYGELLREGAGGTSFDIARNAPVQNIKNIRAQKNLGTKTLYTVTHPSQLLRAMENTIGRSEEIGRATQYFGNKKAFASGGATDAESRILGANAARNNTVNFARAGTYGRVANSVLPYLNAGIQGSRTLLRNVKDRPVQTLTKVAIVGFLPTATTTVWNLSSPDRKAAYDDINEYEKQGNIIIVPPFPKKDPKTGRWNVIKIPVSQEIANMNNIVRNGVEAAHKDAPLAFNKIAGDLLGTATSLNAQSGRQLVGQLTPQAVKPAIEATVNQNLFTGNKIIPDSQKNLEHKDQYGNYTSGTAKVLGRTLNISPRVIDNTVKTSAGGLGQNAINLTDKLLAANHTISPSEVQGKDFKQSITDRFIGATGQSVYAKADQKQADLSKQLQMLPGYKSMSPADKAKALNRMQGDVSKTFLPPQDGKQHVLSLRQQGLASGKPDLNSYLTSQAGTGSAAKDYNTKPDAEYKAALDRFNKNSASYNDAQKLKANNELSKLKVGSSYDKNIRDLYALSKSQINDYITTNKDGKAVADKLKSYDQALYDSGNTSTLKFRNGFAVATKGSRAKSTGTKSRKISSSKIPASKIPKIKTFKQPKLKAFKVAKVNAKKMKVPTAKVGYKLPKVPVAKKAIA